MNKEDKDRLDILNGIADLWVKNAFAIVVMGVFIGASIKLICYTDTWQEMTSMGSFDAIVMFVLRYYFADKKKK